MRPIGVMAKTEAAFCRPTSRVFLSVAMLVGCREAPSLHGDLVDLIPSHLRNASEFSCVGFYDACIRDSADTTEYFYADSSGLVKTVGMQIRSSAPGGAMLFDTLTMTMTERFGSPFSCEEPPTGRVTHSKRWRAASGILLALAFTEPGPSDEFPGVVQLTYTTQTGECVGVPGPPLPG